MARPSKPVIMLEGHRTKAELETRRRAEAELLTGESWKEYPEVKANKKAHKFFKRLTELYSRIEKNDALTEPIINRYCLLQAECADFKSDRDTFRANLEELMNNDELEVTEKYKLQAQMQKSIIDADKQIQAKRKMLLDIERETLMTLKAQMAAIPKSPAEPKPNKFIGSGTYGR
jgi:hypothetical protein